MTDIAKLYEELRSIIDGGSESFTHEDAVQYLKDRLAQPEQSCPECVFGVCHCKPLAQPEQEPVAWVNKNNMLFNVCMKFSSELTPLYTTPPQPKEPEQEPVAYLVTGPYEKIAFSDIGSANAYCKGLNTGFDTDAYLVSPLYTTPPQRTWVGLTDEEIVQCQQGNIYHFYRCIEAKLKEKNS